MAEIYDSPAEGNNKTTIIIVAVVAVILLLCCCLVIAGVSGYFIFSENGVSIPLLGPSLDETFTYYEDDYDIKFDYPGEWYAEGDYGDFYVGTVRGVEDMDEPEPGEFYMNVFFQDKDWVDGSTPEEALEEMIGYIEDDELEVSSIKSIKVGGNEGAYITLSGDSSDFDANIDGMVVIWEVDENYYGQAIGFTSEASFSKFRGTMEAILDSIEADIEY